MPETKIFELRDRATFVPVLASYIAPYDHPEGDPERYLMRRAGYGERLVLLTRLEGGSPAEWDANAWGNRTMQVAHMHILRAWLTLTSGDVIDVEFILNETLEPKVSERFTAPI